MLHAPAHSYAARTPMRVLIVDDEELGRELLSSRLRGVPDVELLGESSNGLDALSAIRELRPDVVFMDIEMPGLDGLRVLEHVAAAELPLVVFVTAHSDYATRAFELNATDYVLKPFTTPRLIEAVERARARLSATTDAPGERRLLLVDNGESGAEGAADSGAPGLVGQRTRRLLVRDRVGFALVQLSEIESIEAAGNYVRILSGRRTWVMRSTMTDIEAILDPDQFARVHRSTIVNIDAIERITPHASGDFELRLHSGRVLRMSRSYRRRLLP
jgi:two-component system LytT family response regulator